VHESLQGCGAPFHAGGGIVRRRIQGSRAMRLNLVGLGQRVFEIASLLEHARFRRCPGLRAMDALPGMHPPMLASATMSPDMCGEVLCDSIWISVSLFHTILPFVTITEPVPPIGSGHAPEIV